MAEEKADVQKDIEEGDQTPNKTGEAEDGEVVDKTEEVYEVPIRKHSFNPYAENRVLKRENKELKTKVEEGDADEAVETDTSEIARTVQKAVSPVLDVVRRQEDERELGAYLSQNPEMKQYEKKARAVMEHPSYKDVAIDFIFSALANKDAEMRGASKAKEAEDKVRKNKISGTASRRESDGQLDIWNLSNEEFKALQNKARTTGVKLT